MFLPLSGNYATNDLLEIQTIGAQILPANPVSTGCKPSQSQKAIGLLAGATVLA
jgi:hypothetical protein